MPGLVSTGYVRSKINSNEEFRQPSSPSRTSSFRSQKRGAPHFSSPEGMLMPSCMQPPPMYGPRGPTIPPKYMNTKKSFEIHKNFWCEICDKEFPSKYELEGHKSDHKICGIDGCTFTGDASILLNHIENTHSSGLYNRIKKLSTPEEIAKWREERRKRYPTRSNIELRQKAQEEKMKRGERIGKKDNRFGSRHERRPMRNNEQIEQKIVLRRPVAKDTNQKKSKSSQHGYPMASEVVNASEFEYEELCKGKLQRFNGTSALEDYFRPKTLTEPNPLASLLSIYESDQESESGSENEGLLCQLHPNCNKSLPDEISSRADRRNEITSALRTENIRVGNSFTHADKGISYESTNIKGSIDEAPIQIVEPFEDTVNQNDFRNIETSETRREEIGILLGKSKHSYENCDKVLADKLSPRAFGENEACVLKPENVGDPEIFTHANKSTLNKNANVKGSDDEMPEEMPIQRKVEACERTMQLCDSSREQDNLCNMEKTSEIQKKGAEISSGKNKSSTLEDCRVGKHRKRFRHSKNKKPEESEPEEKKQKAALLDYSKLRARRQNTMLEKLLESDIIHERNVLLQCVRFVVENNFFGIGSKTYT